MMMFVQASLLKVGVHMLAYRYSNYSLIFVPPLLATGETF